MMSDWKRHTFNVLGILLVFLLGSAAGSLLTFGWLRHQTRNMPVLVQRISHRLRLDRAQHARLETIARAASDDLRRLRRQVAPQAREIFVHREAEIRAILRPDQMAEFDRMVVIARRRWGSEGKSTGDARAIGGEPAPARLKTRLPWVRPPRCTFSRWP